MILAGDIGGTKTVLAIYTIESDGVTEHAKERFECGRYGHLSEIVAEFLESNSEMRSSIEQASIGVAGPVRNGRCEVTNLPWVVDADELRTRFGFESVHLLNDLEAIATAIPFLKNDDLIVLNEGMTDPEGVIGIVAPGTGLGEAFLTKCGAGYLAHASEGGHADMAPSTAIEAELLTYLQTRFGHVSYERVISGEGIGNIYEFFRARGKPAEPDWLRDKINAAPDPTPLIDSHSRGVDAVDICVETMNIFISVLGSEVGNMGVKLLPRGGIYLAGGIPPLIIPLLRQGLFMKRFLAKGRMSALVESMPLYVVLNKEPALLGAAWSTVVSQSGKD